MSDQGIEQYQEALKDIGQALGLNRDGLFAEWGPRTIINRILELQIDVREVAETRDEYAAAFVNHEKALGKVQLIEQHLRKGLQIIAERGAERPSGKISRDVEPLVLAFCDGLEEAGNIARAYLGITPLPTLHRVENGKIMVSRWDANFNLTWVEDDGSYLAELKKPKGAE